MLTGALLDDGADGLGHIAAVVLLGLLVVLAVAVFLPGVVVAGVTHPGAVPPAAPSAQRLVACSGAQVLRGTHPESTLPTSGGAVDVARRFLGVRYVFGGTGPATGLDCSGLVQLVYRQLGLALPRTAQQQYDATRRIERDQLQPGDLVFFARTYADPNDWVTHVGIYIGDGQQINAPTEGQVVSIQPVFSGFWGAHFVGGGRV